MLGLYLFLVVVVVIVVAVSVALAVTVVVAVPFAAAAVVVVGRGPEGATLFLSSVSLSHWGTGGHYFLTCICLSTTVWQMLCLLLIWPLPTVILLLHWS